MKKWLAFILLAMLCFISMVAQALHVGTHPNNDVKQAPTIENFDPPESQWWLKNYDVDCYRITDIFGKPHVITLKKGTTTYKSNRWPVYVEYDLVNLKWTNITVEIAPLGEDYSYTILELAPGVYTEGKFYTDMTDEEKRSMWEAYIAKAKSDRAAKDAIKYAPAKFDVTMDPEEYKATLMVGRTEEDLTPEEEAEIALESATYSDEWLRINDPDKWENGGLAPMPGGDQIISEQAKKSRIVAGETVRARARAEREAKARASRRGAAIKAPVMHHVD